MAVLAEPTAETMYIHCRLTVNYTLGKSKSNALMTHHKQTFTYIGSD